jgi:RHS repeat-associated protein
MSFSAFGAYRDPRDWQGAAFCWGYGAGQPCNELFNATTWRGYTGHETVGGVDGGLIHMNGRLYDSVLGRFTSPDPYIPYPEQSQSYNRYSYVRNNPLSFVDPSGFEDEGLDEVGVFGYREHGNFVMSYTPMPDACGNMQPIQGVGCFGDNRRLWPLLDETEGGIPGGDDDEVPMEVCPSNGSSTCEPPLVSVVDELVREMWGPGKFKLSWKGFKSILGIDEKDVARGGLKNASGSLDDAAASARTQPHRPDTVSTHARGRMETRGVSYDSVQEAVRRGTRTFDPATGVGRYDLPASASSTGRAVTVIRNDVTGNSITVIDKGSR